VDRGRAIGLYDGALREIIHAFKYQRRRSIGRALAARMRVAGADLLRDADIAVPVPLHAARRRQRGFNQAADLARGLGLPVVEALRRNRATRSQVELPAAQRHRNVRDAFEVAAPRRRRWLGRRDTAPALDGLCVVLVDDVSTTGATLEACARVLKAAGVREVRALTAARVAGWRR
jgi:ComF family protein